MLDLQKAWKEVIRNQFPETYIIIFVEWSYFSCTVCTLKRIPIRARVSASSLRILSPKDCGSLNKHVGQMFSSRNLHTEGTRVTCTHLKRWNHETGPAMCESASKLSQPHVLPRVRTSYVPSSAVLVNSWELFSFRECTPASTPFDLDFSVEIDAITKNCIVLDVETFHATIFLVEPLNKIESISLDNGNYQW